MDNRMSEAAIVKWLNVCIEEAYIKQDELLLL